MSEVIDSPPQSAPWRPRTWTRLRAADWLLVGCAVGVADVSRELPAHLQLVDVLLAVVFLVGTRIMVGSPENVFARALGRASPWFWLLFVAITLSLLQLGFVGWSLLDTAHDLVALLTFFFMGALLIVRPRALDASLIAWTVMAAVVAVSVTTSNEALRSTGSFFSNPNYAAHYLGTSLVLLLAAPLPRLVRLGLAAAFLVAMVHTGSFGGFTLPVSSALYLVSARVSHWPVALRRVARLLLAAAVVVVAVLVVREFSRSDTDLGSGTSAQRFERSRDTRLAIWSDALAEVPGHPLGVGAHGLVERTDLRYAQPGEVHNDYFAFLVEDGVLGLLAVFGICSVMWRLAPPSGLARALLLGVAVSAVTREVVNFRHVWVALALLTVWDSRERMRSRRLRRPRVTSYTAAAWT